jgi:hypothetical protein
MAEPNDSSLAFFSKATAKQWSYILSLYKDVLKLKAEQRSTKKGGPEELIKLDTWYVRRYIYIYLCIYKTIILNTNAYNTHIAVLYSSVIALDALQGRYARLNTTFKQKNFIFNFELKFKLYIFYFYRIVLISFC